MKKFAAILIGLIFLSGADFAQTNRSLKNRRDISDRALLLKLLDVHSPPENRSARIDEWLKRENETLAAETNIIPADDAPIEEIIKFWAGNRSYEMPKPSETTKRRLLEAVKTDPSMVSSVLDFLPTDAGAVEIITKAIAEVDQTNQISTDFEVNKWLLANDPDRRPDLIETARKIQGKPNDDGKLGSVEYDDELKALAKLEWETAYPIISACWSSGNQRLSTLALTLLYQNAVTNSIDADTFREQLKQIAVDKTAKGYARSIAVEALLQTAWPERDEWFVSLFSDETLADMTDDGFGYEPLSAVVEENPDYWIPKIIKLLGGSNKTIHKAAASSLAKFEKFRARADAMSALLPYLDDTDDWPYSDANGAVYSLNYIYLPESIPVLKRIVQKEEGYVRAYAAEALGAKYQAADAAPILEKALMSEPDTTYQESIIQGLVRCGGLSNEKKIRAVEFYLDNLPLKENGYGEERDPLIGLGIYLSKYESTDEEFTRALLIRASQIEKDRPELSAKIKSLVYTWNNPAADLALLEAIETEKADADDILTATQKREWIRRDYADEMGSWLDSGNKKAGIAAVILEDREEIAKIINGNDTAAQAFLFAAARLTETFVGTSSLTRGTGIEVEVALPLENTSRLFAKKDKDLSAAVERYLEAEDGEIARKLILSEHRGEAKIVGRRLPGQFGGDFKELDKWEEAFRREILNDQNLEEIYAERNVTVRVRNKKAEVTISDNNWETNKSSERKYFLPADKLLKLKSYIAETNFFALKPLSIPSNSCFMPSGSSEFLYLTRNGGVRVYIATPFGTAGDDKYPNLLNFLDGL